MVNNINKFQGLKFGTELCLFTIQRQIFIYHVFINNLLQLMLLTIINYS